MHKKSTVEKIINQINATNAKRIAVLLVLGFSLYHGFVHLRYGIDSCVWLLSSGRYKANQEWQPYGCMLHRYSQIDTRRCLRYLAFYGTYSYFVFVGDSRIKQLYLGFVGHLQQKSGSFHNEAQNETSAIFIDDKLKIKVEFLWSPFLSSHTIDTFRKWDKKDTPSVIVTGSSFATLKAFSKSRATAQEYAFNLTRLIQPADDLKEHNTKVLWVPQSPVYGKLLKPDLDLRGITNSEIHSFNKASAEVLSYSSIKVWWSASLIGEGMMEQSPDGFHLASRSLNHVVQILLNMYCNDHMNFNDGTCCSSPENSTTLQIVTFLFFAICIVIAAVMTVCRWFRKSKSDVVQEEPLLATESDTSVYLPPGDIYTLFISLAKMGFIMCYFFICDRTNFFMKENKYYSEFSFWLPVGYVFILGLFFTEESRFTKVLHRDQINEWKGWMQLVILVYHVTGASQILPINMLIKVLISAYLFLLGYQQFYYAWQIGVAGMVGFFKTLFELNFMTVTLCLCMNRPYQFYNFVPLISFWYMMVYIFLAIPPIITAQSSENNVIQYLYLVIKFLFFFAIITILFMSEVFFEKIFVTRPWKALFVTTDDDIHEWWSRWKLDRYSVLFGMLFAVLYVLAQKYGLFDDNNHSNLFSRSIALSTTFAALVGLGSYMTFTLLCDNEFDCSEIHSYITFVPIVSYIVLRNISGILRTRYSSFFSWFGNIYLELFISQYHIWLAADTHGVLVLIPGYPVLNVIITLFIFVCASHEVNKLTKILLPYAVPSDWRSLLRNVILFFAILVPIGINDGMF